MRIITIVESRSLIGIFTVTYQDDNNESVYAGDHCGAEAAAAKGMSLAIDTDKYMIFGSKSVLDCIPIEFRSKN